MNKPSPVWNSQIAWKTCQAVLNAVKDLHIGKHNWCKGHKADADKARSGCDNCFPQKNFPTTRSESFITRPLAASGQTNPMQLATVNSSPQMNSCNTAVCPKNWDRWTMLGTKNVDSPRLANAHEGAIAHHICKKASYKALIMVTSCNWIQGGFSVPSNQYLVCSQM